MNIAQEMFLGLLRNAFFKLFLFSPTLGYLIKRLRLDIISVYVQGKSTGDILFETGRKIREEWGLLTFKRIRFYRELAQEDLITQNQLRRLENNANIVADALDDTVLISAPSVKTTDNRNVFFVVVGKKPVPLPWERDQDFFEKHPKHKQALLKLREYEKQLVWHEKVWLALVDGL